MKPVYRYIGSIAVGLFVGYCTTRSVPFAIGAFAAAAAINQLDTLAKISDLKREIEELRAKEASGRNL